MNLIKNRKYNGMVIWNTRWRENTILKEYSNPNNIVYKEAEE